MNQIIYYDYEDELRDGNGWNIISETEDAVALRFPTLREARYWCFSNGYDPIIDTQSYNERTQ